MIYNLRHPIARDGETITEARIFAPRADDMRRIVQAEDQPGGEMVASMLTIARLTDLAEWAIEQLSREDLMGLGNATDAMFADRGRH